MSTKGRYLCFGDCCDCCGFDVGKPIFVWLGGSVFVVFLLENYVFNLMYNYCVNYVYEMSFLKSDSVRIAHIYLCGFRYRLGVIFTNKPRRLL